MLSFEYESFEMRAKISESRYKGPREHPGYDVWYYLWLLSHFRPNRIDVFFYSFLLFFFFFRQPINGQLYKNINSHGSESTFYFSYSNLNVQ